jgi:uncharacterized protein (TIGR03083 family)
MTSDSPAAVRQQFRDAAGVFVEILAAVPGDGWANPALGVWTVRDLAGHTSRALITVESYLDAGTNGQEPELPDAVAYLSSAGRAGHADPASIADRGRQAGAALGDDPPAAVAELADRVLALVDGSPDDALVTTPMGTMTLLGYLPTRTFELAVHAVDLAAAVGVPRPPRLAAPVRACLAIVAAVAGGRDDAADVLLALTGRRGLPEGYSVL